MSRLSKILAAFLVGMLGLSACFTLPNPTVFDIAPVPQDIAEARDAAANALYDPESARFRSLRSYRLIENGVEGRVVCGEINGKNRFGGYVGFRPFYYLVGPQIVKMANSDHDFFFPYPRYCNASPSAVGYQPTPPSAGSQGTTPFLESLFHPGFRVITQARESPRGKCLGVYGVPRDGQSVTPASRWVVLYPSGQGELVPLAPTLANLPPGLRKNPSLLDLCRP